MTLVVIGPTVISARTLCKTLNIPIMHIRAANVDQLRGYNQDTIFLIYQKDSIPDL